MGMLRTCKRCRHGYNWVDDSQGFDYLCAQCIEEMAEENKAVADSTLMFPLDEIYMEFGCPVCDKVFFAPLTNVLDTGNPYCPEDSEHGEALVNSDFVKIKE